MTNPKSYRNKIIEYANKTYGTSPEYLWREHPGYAVLRRDDNKKWYGIIMNIPRNRIGMPSSDIIDVLNVKCDPALYDFLCGDGGFRRGYHMGRTWISIVLDGSVSMQQIIPLINRSYELVANKIPRAKRKI